MKRYTELDLQNTLVEYTETSLLRNSAENHGIPPTTLFNRVRGSKPASKAQIINQNLSPAMEERLTEWILFQGSLGYPPPKFGNWPEEYSETTRTSENAGPAGF